MAEEAESDVTALVVNEGDEAYYPCLRWGRGQYKIPRDECIVSAKIALQVTLDEFVSFMGMGTSPSRSPEKWRKFLTITNYGMISSKEGLYPFAVFDVIDHPQMANFIHLIPSEPAAKLLPALYEQVKDDPEAHGLRIETAKTPESRAKHQARLDNLAWKPEMCMAGKPPSSRSKAIAPSPIANGWLPLPTEKFVKWCVVSERRSVAQASRKIGGNKREIDDDVELPCGVRVRTDVGFGSVAMLASVPVGEHFSTKIVGGRLEVVVFRDDVVETEGVETEAGEIENEAE